MSDKSSLDKAYFDRLYAEREDPWNFRTSPYEAAKYATTLKALPRQCYDRGFEAGCSIGVLTAGLATRCSSLIAVDASSLPLTHARETCAGFSNVDICQMRLPQDWPPGSFDLMIFSEVLYYFSRADLDTCVKCIRASLEEGGDIVLVHYTGATDYPQTGDFAAEYVGTALSTFAHRLAFERHPAFRLDVWRKGQ